MAWKYSKKRQRSDGLKQIDGKKKVEKSENKMAEYVQKYGFRVAPKADNQAHPPKDEYIIGVDLANGKDFTAKGGVIR